MGTHLLAGRQVGATSPACAASRLGGDAESRRLLGWLRGFVVLEKYRLLLVVVLSMVAAAAGLAQPLLTKSLIDDGIMAGDMATVYRIAVLMTLMLVVSSLLGLVTRRLYVIASAQILHGMRETVFAHLLRLPPSFYNRVRQGDLLSRLEGDVGEIQRFALDVLLVAMNSLVTLVGAVVVLGMLSAELTLAMGVLLVINATLLRLMRAPLEMATRRAREGGADIASFLVEVLGAAKCVQAFNAQSREQARLQRLQVLQQGHTLSLQTVGYLATGVPNLLLSLGVIGLFVWGSRAIIEESMTLGVLVAFATYFQRAAAPLQSLLGIYAALQRVRVSLDRVAEVLRVAPLKAGKAVAGAAGAILRGDLILSGVEFAYPGSPSLFSPLSYHLPRGSRVAVRGASGAGKSTLVDLLHGHLEASAGSIRLDGVEITSLDRAILRKAIAVVSQETVLFSVSIAENIRYGRPEASDGEVRRAAELAGLGELIKRLPDGLEAAVGQRGVELSGGERQRIALARAILLDPLVLVIDEGTSGLDSELEAQILAETDRLYADRTRILITHRQINEVAFDVVIRLAAHDVA